MAFNRYRGDENVEAITKGAVTSQDDMTPLDMEEEEGARAQTLRERIYVFFSLEDNLFLKGRSPRIVFGTSVNDAGECLRGRGGSFDARSLKENGRKAEKTRTPCTRVGCNGWS